MGLQASLAVALKEWAVVCHALETGRQVMLLRKGGIYELAGEFQLEHRQFVLFPTYLHQDAKMLKPNERDGFEQREAEPRNVRLGAAGVVTDIVRVGSRTEIDAVDHEHVWAAPLIDMRFNYRPDNPLYVLLVRAFRLREAVTVENTPAYAGCKSWVPLGRSISVDGATPVLTDEEYESRRGAILGAVGRSA
jgi:hypothetical protein